LERLGFYCREYRRLMAHWRAVLPKSMLEPDYEALVDDQERGSHPRRKILPGSTGAHRGQTQYY